ncbi:CPBP family intramembrane metalloprotease [Candidatus Gracilibacteria bacterium]|nr:CPBP family intramembrane metalloprotease [Candidatus Gracilibacteria bacterium]
MKFSKKKLWFLIFFLGFLGILSIFTVDFHLEKIIPAEKLAGFEKWQMSLLLMINPTILLTIATTVGVILYDKMGLKLPIFEKILGKNEPKTNWKKSILIGVGAGIFAGFFIHFFSILMAPHLPEVLFANNEMPVISRIFYGGILEEILIRFGSMTLLAWIFYKIFKKKNIWIFGSAIIISSLVFGIGHLPMMKLLVGELSMIIIFYTIFGNFIPGLIFGYLYYKNGLEIVMIAHIVTHMILISMIGLN